LIVRPVATVTTIEVFVGYGIKADATPGLIVRIAEAVRFREGDPPDVTRQFGSYIFER
jgi:hypothetical protein